MSFRIFFRFLSCAHACPHDEDPKTFMSGHNTPFPHWGLKYKSHEENESIQKKVCHTACKYTNSATIFLPSLSIWRIRR